MKITKTLLQGVFIIEQGVFGDHRGWFTESYNAASFKDADINVKFIQDNHSFSAAEGTLRGLHYQVSPKAQTKLVRCTAGSIFDVAVDIRKGSPTFSKWFGIELSAENKRQLLVPKGFAHGFMTLRENTEVQYKVDELYAPEHERIIKWDDPEIGVKWPISVTPILSSKDEQGTYLKDANYNFDIGD